MTKIDLPDAVVFPDGDDPDTYLYAPKRPSIAVDAQGHPQLNVLVAGAVSFLQVTASWGLDASQLDTVRIAVADRTGRPAASLQLRPLRETIEGVVLQLSDRDGGLTELQRSKSSGVPPYHAAFNVMLDADQLELVQAALGGKRSVLSLRYDVTRHVPVAHTNTASRTEEKEESTSGEDGGSWRQRSTKVVAATTHDATEVAESLGVTLDAADWTAVR